MADSKYIGPVVLGAITLAVIGWTIHSMLPPAALRSKNLDETVRAQVKKFDAEKRKMSPTELSKAEAEKHDSDLKAVAASWTKNGVYLSEEQDIRLSKLGDAAIATGALASSDIDFLVATIQDPQIGSKEPGYIHFQAAYDLARVKKFTSAEKDQILKACMPLAKSPDGLDIRCAIVAAKAVHSDAALPAALKMRNSISETDQRIVRAYLADIGYHATE